MRYEEFVKHAIEEFVEGGVIDTEEFPDMELYMDQVITFMNKHLAVYKKEEKDAVVTKTMVGNYAKHSMIPRPQNKRYNRNHLLLLTLIFHLKGTFQMEEIQRFMRPLIENYNSEFDEQIDFLCLYQKIISVYQGEKERLFDEVMGDIDKIKNSLNTEGLTDDDLTEISMLIVNLSLKADAQKYLAQKLMDEYFNKSKKK